MKGFSGVCTDGYRTIDRLDESHSIPRDIHALWVRAGSVCVLPRPYTPLLLLLPNPDAHRTTLGLTARRGALVPREQLASLLRAHTEVSSLPIDDGLAVCVYTRPTLCFVLLFKY